MTASACRACIGPRSNDQTTVCDFGRCRWVEARWRLFRGERPGGHPMKSKSVWTMPVVALALFGSRGIALADTSDVKGPAPLVVAKSGKHCKDDPTCFNRINHAIKPVVHV